MAATRHSGREQLRFTQMRPRVQEEDRARRQAEEERLHQDANRRRTTNREGTAPSLTARSHLRDTGGFCSYLTLIESATLAETVRGACRLLK